jgi:four helix bundle protein
MDLSKEVLKISKSFPSDYKFSLSSQIVRSAVSIPSNISEGSARTSDKEFSRFLDIAQGSAYELETQLVLAESIDIIEQNKLQLLLKELNDLQRMINGFKKTLN